MRRLFLCAFAFFVLLFIILLFYARETYLYDAALHLAIISLACALIWKENLSTTLKSIGFPGELRKLILYSAAGFLAIIAFSIILNLAAIGLHFNDSFKVAEKVADLPLYVVLLAVVFAPFSEELLFRAALVPRFGIIIPAILFGILHLAYGSVMEVVGVIGIGIILGYVYKRSGSITPCIVVHLSYNLISVAVMRMVA